NFNGLIYDDSQPDHCYPIDVGLRCPRVDGKPPIPDLGFAGSGCFWHVCRAASIARRGQERTMRAILVADATPYPHPQEVFTDLLRTMRTSLMLRSFIVLLTILAAALAALGQQKAEVTISLSEAFFDAALEALFENNAPLEFAIAENRDRTSAP